MKTKNEMQLKAFIKSKAMEIGISPQLMLQRYHMECFIDRLSRSDFASQFIIKGGFLISNLVGLSSRSTMDIDTTIKRLKMDEETISHAIEKICSIPANDDFTFVFDKIEPIREDDEYHGFRAYLFANYGIMRGTLTLDITTGDSIYPAEISTKFTRCFDNIPIEILSYPIETILAEKLETIITRSVLNSRPRDFYDVYILTKTVPFDKATLKQALLATAEHRHTREIIENESQNRLAVIESSAELQMQWKKYQTKFKYAKDISFEDTVRAIRDLFSEIGNR